MNFEPNSARAAAMDQLKGPAIGLMATAGIGAAFQLLGLVLNLMGVGMGALAQGNQDIPSMMSGGIGAVFSVIAAAASLWPRCDGRDIQNAAKRDRHRAR